MNNDTASRLSSSLLFQDIAAITFKAYFRFVIRLYIVSAMFCLGFSLIRSLRESNSYIYKSSNEKFHKSLAIELDIVNSKTFTGKVNSLPALFGTLATTEMYMNLIILGNDSCDPLQDQLVEFTKSKSNLRNYVAMIPRGNCSFSKKTYNAQISGFSAVIIYNNPIESYKSAFEGVYMSASPDEETSADIKIFAMHLSHYSAFKLFTGSKNLTSSNDSSKLTHLNKYLPILRIQPKKLNNDHNSNNHFRYPHSKLPFYQRVMIESVILMLTVIISSFVVLSISLALILLHNIFMYKRLKLYETLLQGSILLVDLESDEYMPKLKTVPFPKIQLTNEQLQGDSESVCINIDCCAICLDGFILDDFIRVLPCRHGYHSECIDPWLLKHNRLCPICKRDVFESNHHENENNLVHDNHTSVHSRFINLLRNSVDVFLLQSMGIGISSSTLEIITPLNEQPSDNHEQ